jgi:hypothetical protein
MLNVQYLSELPIYPKFVIPTIAILSLLVIPTLAIARLRDLKHFSLGFFDMFIRFKVDLHALLSGRIQESSMNLL